MEFRGFADLDEKDLGGGTPEGPKHIAPLHNPNGQGIKPDGLIWETCWKCNGSGNFRGMSSRGSKCFACAGKGGKYFKQSRAVREKNREQVKARKVQKAAKGWETWAEANPAEAAYLLAKKATFHIAAEMIEVVRKFGDLSPARLAMVQRFMAKDVERAAAAVERAASAPVVEVGKIIAAFDAAREKGIKTPRMRMDGVTFKAAPMTGKNPGAIYITGENSEDYLGKIIGGKLHTVSSCTPERHKAILDICADPLKAAVAYGKRTGTCSCCGRTLDNHESIEAGIGPICANKYAL